MNTSKGTVKGRLEGPANSINDMQKWLKTIGSPRSKIDKAVFSVLQEIQHNSSPRFDIRV